MITSLLICADCKIEKSQSEYHRYGKRFCPRCRSCESARRRKIYSENENHRQKRLASNRKSREKQGRYLEKRQEYDRKYTEQNLEKVKASKREWDKRNPEVRRMCARNRRAKVRGLPGKCSTSQWEARVAYYGNRCRYCGCDGKMTVDHRIPVSRGGTGFPANLVPACLSCNSRKCDMTELEYVDYMRRRNAD